jgi:hypothetical protein
MAEAEHKQILYGYVQMTRERFLCLRGSRPQRAAFGSRIAPCEGKMAEKRRPVAGRSLKDELLEFTL